MNFTVITKSYNPPAFNIKEILRYAGCKEADFAINALLEECINEVKDKLVEALGEQKYDFICLNFANGDMVGHTGIYEAIEKAVKTIDECVKDVVEAAKANGYEVVQIADHGNADNALNADGTPNTAHSLNPVPIVVVSDRVSKVKDGILADVAPTVLDLMGLSKPAEMTGESLVEFK
jgi:2,3-bisphosphoglycerate-independent phosphoglycerate mutase